MNSSDAPLAMIVDDDPLLLMNACDILEDAGFQCIEGSTGDAAKPLLAQYADKITLLFSDVEMPGETNGFALARYVAEHWPSVEIVIASGRMQPEPGDMPDKATFISKPFSVDIVHEHLKISFPKTKSLNRSKSDPFALAISLSQAQHDYAGKGILSQPPASSCWPFFLVLWEAAAKR